MKGGTTSSATTSTKTTSKFKNPNKNRTFLNRPNASHTVQGQKQSKSRIINRPVQNAVKPQNRLKIQNKPTSSVQRLIPSKMDKTQKHYQSELDGFLKFGGGDASIKQEHQEMPEATEELVDIDFDISGQTISAKMSPAMVQLLNEDDLLRGRIIAKLVKDSADNPGIPVIITNPSDSVHEMANLNTNRPNTLDNMQTNSIEGVNGQGSVKSEKRSSIGSQQTERMSEATTKPTDIYSMWGYESVITLLEVYEETQKQLSLKKPSIVHFWRTVCKNMKKKGYVRLTDKECQQKFESMEARYKEELQKGFTAETSIWEYFNNMEFLAESHSQTPTIEPITLPSKPIVDAKNSSMYESDGASLSSSDNSSSDEESWNGNLNDLTEEQPYKKQKMNPTQETSGIELLRRTYLKVEMKKLKEMKAMRKLQKQQSRLQAERNILLSSMVELLRKNSFQIRKR